MSVSAPPPPGTPMRKVVPPRLVGPYLTGQRDVLAGYVYQAGDPRLVAPQDAYGALRLGFDGSDFAPGMAEYYVIAWPARPCDGYQQREDDELFIDPMPIPVGATLTRVRTGSEEVVAEYDGIGWLQLAGEA